MQVASLFTVLALPMRVLGFFLEMVPPSVVARRRLDWVFREPDPSPIADPVPLPAGPLSVRVTDLTYRYPSAGEGQGVDQAGATPARSTGHNGQEPAASGGRNGKAAVQTGEPRQGRIQLQTGTPNHGRNNPQNRLPNQPVSRSSTG